MIVALPLAVPFVVKFAAPFAVVLAPFPSSAADTWPGVSGLGAGDGTTDDEAGICPTPMGTICPLTRWCWVGIYEYGVKVNGYGVHGLVPAVVCGGTVTGTADATVEDEDEAVIDCCCCWGWAAAAVGAWADAGFGCDSVIAVFSFQASPYASEKFYEKIHFVKMPKLLAEVKR